MDKTESAIIGRLRQALLDLLDGTPNSLPIECGQVEDKGLQALCETTDLLITKFIEAHDFLSRLSNGLLEVDPPPRNFLISPFKRLHSNLRHLTWQTKQVATGDLSQHVDFLGEFSHAFNSMIAALKEKRQIELELQRAHADLVQANTEIMDSIRYAHTIQKAFLPNPQEIACHLSDYFIIWRPKDIIGGDIYKFKAVKEGFLFAVIDCTGHGVPGAIMTMISGECFDRAVEDVGYHDPAQVLKQLNWLVKSSLNQHHADSPSDDGLDIGICFVNKASGNAVFSGAKIGLWCLRNGILDEISSDRQSIGYKKSKLDFAYKNHTVPIDHDTTLYMTTDGMLHQSGGPKLLPFGKRRFRRLLLEHGGEPCYKQMPAIENEIDKYRGNEPQLDDITVVGFNALSGPGGQTNGRFRV